MGYRFGVLGTFELHRDGVPIRVPRTKSRLLLALLLANANRRVTIEQLVCELWTSPPRSAIANLRTYVAELRHLITESTYLVTAPGGYELQLAPDESDLRMYQTRVAAGNAALNRGDTRAAVDEFGEGERLWRGPAFFGLRQAPTLAAFAESAETLRLTTVERCAAARLELGGDPSLIIDLHRHLAQHPLREQAWMTLVRAHAVAGDIEAALTAYRKARAQLVEHLGIEPGPDLTELHRAILNRDPSVLCPAHEPQAARVEREPANEHAAVEAPSQPPAPTAPVQPARRTRQEPLPVPAQLPADVVGFTGRVEELRQLTAIVEEARARDATTVPVIAIAGHAGAGKTALAVHFAHRVRGDFPDGQLYVNLRGFDLNGKIAAPTDVARRFLQALGVDPRHIPDELDAQTALYRSTLAERRMLVLLDNARNTEQVRPLLPTAPGCLVVVTSRRLLTGLVAAEGARPFGLGLLAVQEAHELLARRLGADRLRRAPDATSDIIARCARLPLALTIAAARAATRPDLPLQSLAAQLANTEDRLDLFATDDPATDVRAVFSWSYQTLQAPAARLFRLFGLHPGPDIGVHTAASLVALPVCQTRTLLRELSDTSLISESSSDRFGFHDLLRAYAAELVHAEETEAERTEALRRVLDHLVHTAYAADRSIRPCNDPIDLGVPAPGVVPQAPADKRQALDWFAAEDAVLTTAVAHAAASGFDEHSCRLAWTMRTFLDINGRWHDLAALSNTALDAARRLEDLVVQGDLHRNIALFGIRTSIRQETLPNLERALALYRQAGDPIGRAAAHNAIGIVMDHLGRHDESLDHTEQAFALIKASGHKPGQAMTLGNLGWLHSQRGSQGRAIECCRSAIALYQEIKDPQGESSIWHSLGLAYSRMGDLAEAGRCYHRSLELCRGAADRYRIAFVLGYIGDNHLAMREHDAARDSWRQALVILEDLDHPKAAGIRIKLAKLTSPATP